MTTPRPPVRRSVATRVLLAAAAGATVISLANCGQYTSGNLLAPTYCGADGGPPNCLPVGTAHDAGADGGTDGGLGGDR